MGLSLVQSRALRGLEAARVTVEVHLANGLPSFTLVGLADVEVKEARERVRCAIQNAGLQFPHNQRITVNLAPADLPVSQDRLREDPSITIRDIDSNDELSDAALIGRFLLPFIFVLVYAMAVNTTAQFLMNGVVEEKENRLMEILATSLRPLDLLWGKLLGLGALSLTQVVLWLGAGLIIMQVNDDAREFISGVTFRAGDGAAVNQKLLRQGVIVRPIGGYGLPEWLRVTIGTEPENARFLEALEKAL